MGYVLILNFGVMGLIATTLIAGLPSIFWSLIFAKKHYGVTIDWASSAKILLSSAVTATLTYFIIAQLSFSSWIRLVIGVVIFLLIWVPMIIITRSVTRADIDNIRSMTTALGPVGKILNTFLRVIEKILPISKPKPTTKNQTA
jgi:hypothetical protein